MNQHRINSLVGNNTGNFRGRGYLLEDIREAMRTFNLTHLKLRRRIDSEIREGGRFGSKTRKPKLDAYIDRLIKEDDEEPKRSTSFRHFVGITEIQANLLIGILNTSRAIQQESLEIWRKAIGNRFGSYNASSGSVGHEGLLRRVSSTQALTGTSRIEINNIFNGAVNLSDREQVSEVAEELANETIAQLRAAGLRV